MKLTIDQWLQLLVAMSTFFVAIAAIWGQRITHLVGLGAKLHLQLQDPQGEFSKSARYYHIKAWNSNKWTQATNVRVVISGFARQASDEDYIQQLLVGPLQLKRRFEKCNPQYSILGADAIFDLGCINRKNFRFITYEEADDFLGTIQPNQSVRIELRVLSDNAESPPLLLEITWDGAWSDESSIMAKHLIINEVGPKSWYKKLFAG